MTKSEQLIKEFEVALSAIVQKLKQDLAIIRGNRPSVEIIEKLKVNVYDRVLAVNQLGSLTILPPRTIQITVWDANAMGAVMKAIEAAHLGFSTTNNGNNILATLSPLGDERREELMKLVKKTAEAARIQIRARRDETIKHVKDAENKKEITEDEAFKGKEKTQKAVDKANGEVESAVQNKLIELGE